MADHESSDNLLVFDLSSSSDEDFDSDLQSEESALGIAHPSRSQYWNELSVSEREQALSEYSKTRKKSYDISRRKAMISDLSDEVHDWSLKPRKIVEVLRYPLLSTNTVFTTRQAFQLRVAEVCQMLNTIPRWHRIETDPKGKRAGISLGYACARSYSTTDPFIAKATKKLGQGWRVTLVNISRGSRRSSVEGKTSRKCAFTAEQLAPLILESIRSDPTMSAVDIRDDLKGYVRDQSLTPSMIQSIRKQARLIAFGKPDRNVQYMQNAVDLATRCGHRAYLETMDHGEVKRILIRMAHASHKRVESRKHRTDRISFDMEQWQIDNSESLRTSLEPGTNSKYVYGVYFAPSTSIARFNRTLRIFTADAAHLKWGSYTLYSLYGRNANMGAICLAHAIIFGNEDKRAWKSFFSFVIEHYPQLNKSTTTIISDKDKGLLAGINSTLPCAAGFHCSLHRKKNIVGKFRTLAGSLYTRAVCAVTIEDLEREKKKMDQLLSEKEKRAIFSVPDELQFPISRIVTGAVMYGKSTNGMSEAMNSANEPFRVQGLDIYQAFGKMISLEKHRFDENRRNAEARIHRLSEYARVKYEQNAILAEGCFVEAESHTSANIRCEATQKYFQVLVPDGSGGAGKKVGACTCGYPEYNYFPCEHIIAFANVRGLADYEITPLEYHTRTLKEQYAGSLTFRSVVLAEAEQDEPISTLKLAPDVVKKRGRPQKRRYKSMLETSKRQRVYLCSLCRKSNHIARNCPHRSQS